jgi:intracellular multiplication protein IcmK
MRSLIVGLLISLLGYTTVLASQTDIPSLGDPESRFQKSVDDLLPFSPAERATLRKRLQEQQNAVESVLPAQINTGTRRLKLQPGTPPPQISLAQGYVSSIALYDSSGAPWPLTSVVTGNTDILRVEKPDGLEPGHILILEALRDVGNTNLVITLKKYDLPVTMSISIEPSTAKQRTTDALISFLADRRGPLASEQEIISTGEASPVDDILLSFLDGVPPAQAKKLTLQANEGSLEAWSLGESIYMRTRDTLLWPAYIRRTNGSGDIRVYEVPDVPEVVVSISGKAETILVTK